jgi:hypothetical protein
VRGIKAIVHPDGTPPLCDLLSRSRSVSEDSIRFLVDAGADVNAVSPQNGMAPLHLALYNSNSFKICRELLALGANPHIRHRVLGVLPLGMIPIARCSCVMTNSLLREVTVEEPGVAPVLESQCPAIVLASHLGVVSELIPRFAEACVQYRRLFVGDHDRVCVPVLSPC